MNNRLIRTTIPWITLYISHAHNISGSIFGKSNWIAEDPVREAYSWSQDVNDDGLLVLYNTMEGDCDSKTRMVVV